MPVVRVASRVFCVVTAPISPHAPPPPPIPFYGVVIRDLILARHRQGRYVGDMVAAVVSEDESTAFRALELIDVEYAELPG